MEDVFVGVFEVRKLDGCELLPEDSSGGFVRCYVAAADRVGAVERIIAYLEKEHCMVVSVEWCMQRDQLSPDMDDHENGDECSRLAVEDRDVVIGRLDVWGDEEMS